MNIALISKNVPADLTIFLKDFRKCLIAQMYKVLAFVIDCNTESCEIVFELAAIPMNHYFKQKACI